MVSLGELRTLCNERGLSCRNANGKYLSKDQLVNMLENKSGGGSYSFNDLEFNHDSVFSFASYWWHKLGMHSWYSDGQDGYYFNNYESRYMSRAHTHIYRIDKRDQVYDYYYTTSGQDGNHIHVQQVITVSSLWEAGDFFYDLNREIGAAPEGQI